MAFAGGNRAQARFLNFRRTPGVSRDPDEAKAADAAFLLQRPSQRSAAAIVCAISAAPCAEETKPASYADGA